jgi:hypothetical protein
MRMLHHGPDPSRSTEYKVVARSFVASWRAPLRSFASNSRRIVKCTDSSSHWFPSLVFAKTSSWQHRLSLGTRCRRQALATQERARPCGALGLDRLARLKQGAAMP